MDYKRDGGGRLMGEAEPAAAAAAAAEAVDMHDPNPTFDKIPKMVSNFNTGLQRLDIFLKKAKNLQQYQFAFALAGEVFKYANTAQRVELYWKTLANAYGARFVKE